MIGGDTSGALMHDRTNNADVDWRPRVALS